MRRTQGLQFKLSLTFILILIPLVIVSLFANNYSQRIMNEQIRERTKGALQTTLAYMDQMASNMDQQTLLISSNPSIVNIWRDKRDPFVPDNLYDVHTVQQQAEFPDQHQRLDQGGLYSARRERQRRLDDARRHPLASDQGGSLVPAGGERRRGAVDVRPRIGGRRRR
ncbi:hypothetical protein [Cohnella rhizosphaerae]|uniref:Uncharacterized protein n=1 Tax=Cohnella rhizosphaerae TaxID=1457232 RepID=A0A9X4QS99_9BACL|nr:hypothetical protein [Cohnella rhizosphaerae]MDG0809876.1 hypothetical protein [Cohnella rhizosphaerae]